MQLLYALVISIQLATPDSVVRLTAAQVTTDLTYFRDVYAVRERAYTPKARARMLAFINRQINEAKSMTREQLALVIAEAQAFTGNNHTQDRVFGGERNFHVVPVAFWWFTEGA